MTIRGTHSPKLQVASELTSQHVLDDNISATVSIHKCVAVSAGSYWLCGTSQAAYPKNYRHEDGGVYNGQWQGRNKQGLGTYQYPEGAKYKGEWRNNYKEGRGVYTFPKVTL